MKTFLIVGGNGSVGKATSVRLAEKGYAVVVSTSRDVGGKQPNLVHLDLCDKASIESCAKDIPELDGILFTSGLQPTLSLDDLTWEHLSGMIDIHFRGVLWAIKCMRGRLKRGALIVLMSSVAAYKGSYDPSYASLKGAIISLTRTLAKELSPDVRVNAIAPSLIADSPVFNQMSDDFRKRHLDASLNKRLLTASEISDTVLFLIEQKHMIGQIIHLNGGQYYGA